MTSTDAFKSKTCVIPLYHLLGQYLLPQPTPTPNLFLSLTHLMLIANINHGKSPFWAVWLMLDLYASDGWKWGERELFFCTYPGIYLCMLFYFSCSMNTFFLIIFCFLFRKCCFGELIISHCTSIKNVFLLLFVYVASFQGEHWKLNCLLYDFPNVKEKY